MGYLSRQIANITDPMPITLASQKNFFIIEPLSTTEKVPLAIKIEVNITSSNPPSESLLYAVNHDGSKLFSLVGTTDPNKVEGYTYYLSGSKSETAENIRNTLLADSWFAAMFEVEIPVYFENDIPVAGNTINLKSKGFGTPYNIRVAASNSRMFTVTHTPEEGSENHDAITGEQIETGIELDIYENTSVNLGCDNRPNAESRGTLFVSLQKTYSGKPLWFELNTLLAKKCSYNLPPAEGGWFDAGTIKDFRFVAKVKDKNSYPFYYSDVLYVLNGYDYPLNNFNPSPYIFTNEHPVSLLSNKKSGKYVTGQKEYLNFLFADTNKGIDLGNSEFNIGIGCRLFDGKGRHIATLHYEDKTRPRTSFKTVNTCEVDLTTTLDEYPETTKAELFITRNNVAISDSLTLDILPECLHRLNQFTFLNRLGGWDSFNADTETTVENKQTPTTFNKTITPGMSRGESIESVNKKEIKQTYTIKTHPLDATTRLWLQELMASPVVLDNQGNYIIIEEADLPISEDRQPFALKYRITEKYNG